MLSSQSRHVGTNPIVWLCDQEPVRTFHKRPPPEKGKPKRWWTYLSLFRLTIHHIQGIKNELADYISRDNFGALLDETSEALVKLVIQRMEVQLDLSMRTAGVLEDLSSTDYQQGYQSVLQTLSDGLEARLIDGARLYKIFSTSIMRTLWLCLRQGWTIAYTGAISAQGTQAVTALWTLSGNVCTPT